VVVAKGNKQNHGETSARIGILRAGIWTKNVCNMKQGCH
jgi:hypothetical protein